MSEQGDALRDLGEAGVLQAICWAYDSAYARVVQDYDPETGHDQGWIGTTAHKLLPDRLDRVFSCNKYAVESVADATAGLDVLASGLLSGEMQRMPRVPPGIVVRDDLNGSPGWRAGPWRWLLSSFVYGHGHHIPWPRKSATKQRVASQPPVDQLAFPEDIMGLPVAKDGLADLSARAEAPTSTLVLAHAVDADSGAGQLLLGRSRLNDGGGEAWWWVQDLLLLPPGDTGSGYEPPMPGGPAGSGPVDDAPVRLRRNSDEGRSASEDE